MKSEGEILTKGEVDVMIDTTEQDQIKVLIAILYLTGHRVSEVLQLKKEDITFVNKRMNIKLIVEKRREYFEHTIWFNIERTPYIDLIKSYVYSLKDNQLLFESEYSDTHITRQYVGRILRSLNPRVHPHLFRHTRATRLANLGYTEFQIQNWFGWKSSGQATGYVAKGPTLLGNMGDNID